MPISAITADAGVACAVGRGFWRLRDSSQNREDINFAIRKLDDDDKQWTEVKSNREEKFFILESELKEVKQAEKQIAQTHEKHSKLLNKAIR